MDDIFATKINVNQSRNIHNLFIPISEEERRHLIITGKNGSGKTSLLMDLFTFLNQIKTGHYDKYEEHKNNLSSYRAYRNKEIIIPKTITSKNIEDTIKSEENWFRQFGGTQIHFKNIFL